MTTSCSEAFRDAIAAAGIEPPEVVEADGKLHRFPSNGKRGDDGGWYVLHEDGVPAGAFGCWRAGVNETWRAESSRTFTAEERRDYAKKIRAIQEQRANEEERRHAEARERAASIWKAATPPGDHHYLLRKDVKAHGLRVHEGALVIPMRDGDALHSLQFIGPDGEKRFLTGGRVSGCYHSIGKPDGVLCIAEGYATAASVHEATGFAVAVAFNAGNLQAVAKALRAKFTQARIVIAGDNDASGTGQSKAEEAARAVGAMVAIPAEAGADWNDVQVKSGSEAVKAAIEGAQPMSVSTEDGVKDSKPAAESQRTVDAETITRLAALSFLEYDRIRVAEAEKLGVRAQTLDDQVKRARGTESEGVQMFAEVEPWPDPVDGGRLLDSLAASCKRFIVLSPHADTALALWVLFTHFIEAVDVAPILALLSPEKRCGKTTCVDWLSRLVLRPMPSSNISPAALFRAVEAWKPTLLIDEADSFAREDEELRGMLNSGHTRATAYVIRCEGEDFEPKQFSTWAAKLLALIGKLPDTLQDRAIAIELRRKLPSDRVEKLRHASTEEFETLARRCVRFAQDNAPIIRAARPVIPEELHDRAADNWEPLLAIAEVAGGEWPKFAQKAASVLSGATPDGDSTKTELLRDIQAAFKERFAEREYVGSAELVTALTEDKEGRWCEFNKGKPLTQRQLARLMRSFGIAPSAVRFDGERAKGYRVEGFNDAFARYTPLFIRDNVTPPNRSRTYGENQTVSASDAERIENEAKSIACHECHAVTDENPPSGRERGGEGI